MDSIGNCYLDTSTILCGIHPHEKYHKRAKKILKTDYLLSEIVHTELKKIKIRRFKIYADLLKEFSEIEKGWTFDKVFRRCFKSNFSNVKNDARHLTELYEYLLKELGVDGLTQLDGDLLYQFTEKLDHIFTNMEFYIMRQLHILTDPTIAARRIVLENSGGKYNKIKREFKKLKDYTQNKPDVKILIHGVEYSCHRRNFLNIISKDIYMYSIRSDVKQKAKKIYPELFFEIHHLPLLRNAVFT